MAGKSKKRSAQAQASKRRRKEEKRRKQKLKTAKLKATRSSIGKRHQEQLKRLVPNAWDGENHLDVAIFDDDVFATLAVEQQEQVAAVKKSLDLIGAGKLDQAAEAVAAISRKSGLVDWRMLIRGLTSWLADDFAAAETAWSRLVADRRPARIAKALQLARRDDLTELAAAASGAASPAQTDNQSSSKSNDDKLEISSELAAPSRS